MYWYFTNIFWILSNCILTELEVPEALDRTENLEGTSLVYYIKQETQVSGSDYSSFLHQYIRKESNLVVNGFGYEYSQTTTKNIDGYVTLQDERFEIKEGSTLNLSISIAPQESDENAFPEMTSELDMNLIVGFETKSQDYHFEMLVDNDELQLTEKGEVLEKEFNLYNAKKQKIGSVLYTLNGLTEAESFVVLDLDGNEVWANIWTHFYTKAFLLFGKAFVFFKKYLRRPLKFVLL